MLVCRWTDRENWACWCRRPRLNKLPTTRQGVTVLVCTHPQYRCAALHCGTHWFQCKLKLEMSEPPEPCQGLRMGVRGWMGLRERVSPHFHVLGPRASGKGTISGSRGDWARCNSGQKPEEEVGRLWGWRMRKVREARNSMETSNVSRGRSKTVVRLGKVHLGSLWPWRRHSWCPQVCIWPSGSHTSLLHHDVPSLRDGTTTWPCPSAERSPCLAQPLLDISSG